MLVAVFYCDADNLCGIWGFGLQYNDTKKGVIRIEAVDYGVRIVQIEMRFLRKFLIGRRVHTLGIDFVHIGR